MTTQMTLQNAIDTNEEWFIPFKRTQLAKKIPKYAKPYTYPITKMFTEFAFEYHQEQPSDWTLQSVKTFFDHVGEDMFAHNDLFRATRPVLLNYFEYLGKKKIISNTEAFLDEIKTQFKIMKDRKEEENGCPW